MFAGVAANFTNGLGPVQLPNEYSWHLGNKPNFTFNATINGQQYMDSGHQVGSLNGVTFTCGPSAKDSTQVLKAAGTAYCVPSEANANLIIFVRSLMRWDNTGATTNRISFVVNTWSTRDAGTADSATHLGFGYTSAGGLPGTLLQANVDLVTNAGGFTDIGGPWAEAGAGLGNWFIVEWIINPNTNTWVGRMPDGSWRSFVNANLTNAVYKGIYPSWEPFYGGGFTAGDVDAEIIDMKASTYESMRASQVRYCNALLRRAGAAALTVPSYTPPPDPAPMLVAAGGIAVSPPNVTYRNLADTANYVCDGDELIVAMLFNDDSTTDPVAYTGHTLLASRDGGSTVSGILMKRFASAGETETGIPNAVADQAICLIFKNASDVGNITINNWGQSASVDPIIPGCPFQVTDGSSLAASFLMCDNFSTPIQFDATAPPQGMTLRRVNKVVGSGADSRGAAYVTDGGVAGYGGGIVDSVGGAWVAFTVEVKA